MGLNESGKTTILQALNWFSKPDEYEPTELIPKSKRGLFDGDISVVATVELEEEDREELVTLLKREQNFIVHEFPNELEVTRVFKYKDSAHIDSEDLWSIDIVGKSKKQKKLRSIDSIDTVWEWLVDHISDNMLPRMIYYENFLFDFPDSIYLEWLGPDGQEGHANARYRDVIQDVLNSIDRNYDIERHLVQRFKTGERHDKDAIEAVLNEIGAKITGVVVAAWREIIRDEEAKIEVVVGPNLDKDERGVYVKLRIKEGRTTYLIRERSLGFRWFFSFVLFTHFRTYRDTTRRNAVFLLDEPASNLHPAAQTKLLEAFASLPKRQIVIYSTHSHHMVRPDWLGGTFVVKNAGKDYSGLDTDFNSQLTEVEAQRYYSYVAKHPKDTDLYRPILDALDYQPGPLERIPSLIMVEGRSDYYILRYFIEVLKIGELVAEGIYPGTGKDKIADLVAMYLAWGRQFVVLLDADQGAKRTARNMRKRFGAVVEGRVLTLDEVSDEWDEKALEDLIDNHDKQKIIESVFGSAGKISKQRLIAAVEGAFVNEITIAPQIQTRKRFEKLVAALNSPLELVVQVR